MISDKMINVMKSKIVYIIISLMPMMWFGCKEEGRIDHIDDNAPAPAQVSQVTVRNTSGGAVLKYKVPTDKNLLYVQAVYEIQRGVQRETKSSYYKDSLVLEGFGDTREYDVELFSVGKNGKMSEPLKVKVNPFTPPIHLASVQLRETFGGIALYVDNPERAILAIEMMLDTLNAGYNSIARTFYTSSAKAYFTYRGLDTKPYNVAVQMRDRWEHYSEMTEAKITPMFEEFIPKNTWVHVILPSDSYLAIENNNPNYQPHRAWDGIINNQDMMFASATAPMPQWFTWDMGVTAIIGRLKIWHRGPGTRAWANQPNNVKKFELYGSLSPNPEGIWDDSWIPLGKFEAVKPSEGETITEADHYYGNVEGIDFDVIVDEEFAPDPFVPVRYIRFKTTETFVGPSPTGTVYLSEISFWGKILD